jgi:ABC-type polysaccharide/polyol phosphate transport system ATPase subunit
MMTSHDLHDAPKDPAAEPSINLSKTQQTIRFEPVISVSNLTKTYQLYARPIDRLKEALGLWGTKSTTFHALADVNFTISRGEQIGILGPNGAGKSTLLQILSGVSSQSTGTVAVRGTVAALLELGAGFNPELSGRENAEFLLKLYNYSGATIAKKVDEVRAFADIGTFFDQPMKLYSSGMFVRVAFAANTLADPDILIVDEALSVGDVRFQKKCIDYMQRLKERGVTVILVTHDIFTAKSFCERLLLLNNGRLVCDGAPADVISQYYALLFPQGLNPRTVPPAPLPSPQSQSFEQSRSDVAGERYDSSAFTMTVSDSDLRQSWGVGGARVKALHVHELRAPNFLSQTARLKIDLELELDTTQIATICREHNVAPKLFVGVRVDSRKGIVLFDLANESDGPGGLDIDPLLDSNAIVSIDCAMPTLSADNYFLTPGIAVGSIGHLVPLWSCDNAAMITIESSQTVLGLMKPEYTVRRVG